MPLAVVAVAAVGSALVKANAAKKAAEAQDTALNNIKGVDIASAIQAARDQAEANAAASNELEAKYNPGTSYLRGVVDDKVGEQLSGDTGVINTRNSILAKLLDSANSVSRPEDNALIRESSDAILQDLRLGGSIDPEAQAAAVRGALQTSGNAGTLGSAASRGLVARDLGLTSMQLRQAREDRALNAGNTLFQGNLSADQLKANILGNTGNLASTAAAQDLQRVGSLSQLIDARAKPTAGLDPSSVVDLMVRNNDLKNNVTLKTGDVKAGLTASNGANLSSAIGSVASLYSGGMAGGAGGGFASMFSGK